MSIDFKHWLDRAEEIPFRMADLQIDPKANREMRWAWEYLRDIERAARCLVSGAYIDPNPKLRDFGVAKIRVGSVSFTDLVSAIESLNQVADYYRSPMPTLGDDGYPLDPLESRHITYPKDPRDDKPIKPTWDLLCSGCNKRKTVPTNQKLCNKCRRSLLKERSA